MSVETKGQAAAGFVPDLARYEQMLFGRDRFDMANDMTVDEVDAWVREERHKVMYRDESKID